MLSNFIQCFNIQRCQIKPRGNHTGHFGTENFYYTVCGSYHDICCPENKNASAYITFHWTVELIIIKFPIKSKEKIEWQDAYSLTTPLSKHSYETIS